LILEGDWRRRAYLDGFDEILSAQQTESDAAQQLGDVLTTHVLVVVDPANDRLEDDLLVLDVQVVAADDLDHRLVGQHQQLVAFRRDVREMLHDEPAATTIHTGKSQNFQTL